MDHISGFLSRYLSPYFKNERVKESVAKICSEVLKTEILVHQISIKSGVCVVAGSQSIKHQLFLHQEEIMKRFRDVKELSKIISSVR
jgi:hypothetical protein